MTDPNEASKKTSEHRAPADQPARPPKDHAEDHAEHPAGHPTEHPGPHDAAAKPAAEHPGEPHETRDAAHLEENPFEHPGIAVETTAARETGAEIDAHAGHAHHADAEAEIVAASGPLDPPPPPILAETTPSRPTEPTPAAPEAAARRGGTPIWLTGLIAVALGGGLGWIYVDKAATQSGDSARIAALEEALRTAQQHLAAVEQRPASAAPADLAARLTAVETGLRAQAQRPPGTADTSGIEARIAKLEQRPAPAAPDVAGPIAAATAALTAQMSALDAKLQQVATQEATRAATAARLRAASAALDAGQKLGDLPGAPPALARFAQTPPPTEPALRLAFPAAASAAEAASVPAAEGYSFAERMWRRAQMLVTVRQGDKVLVGAPAAVTLNTARGKLEAGDLAGAVAALAALDGPAARAMAGWRDNAQALVDARAALASLGARS
jgi:hypothetical protein